jgi:RNA recognition motif. (a.k.a. RRM, RBD, or RNP domain)
MHYNRLVYSTMSCFSTKNYGQRLTIFVGGICTSISEDLLLSYFSQFGQIHWITFQPRGHGFKRSANEGVSGKQPHRGCGLLKMNNEQGFDAVLERKIHHFQNSTMECRPAFSAGDRKRLNQQIAKEGRKVFVGGLPQSIEKHTLYEFFSRIVEIEDITLIKKEGREHSFCFLFLRGKGTGKVLYGNEYIIQEGVKVRCQEPLTQQQITEQKQEELAAEQQLSQNQPRNLYKQGVDAVQQASTGDTSTNFAAHAIQASRAMVSEQLDHRPQNLRFRKNRLQRPYFSNPLLRDSKLASEIRQHRCKHRASPISTICRPLDHAIHKLKSKCQVTGCLQKIFNQNPERNHDDRQLMLSAEIDECAMVNPGSTLKKSSIGSSEEVQEQNKKMYRHSDFYQSLKEKHRSLRVCGIKHYTPFCF